MLIPATDTTRAPRGQEEEGKDYYFTTREKFQELNGQGGFIEHAQFGSNFYGTSFKAVEAIEEKGRVCILDIEMEVCLPDTRPPDPILFSSFGLFANHFLFSGR